MSRSNRTRRGTRSLFDRVEWVGSAIVARRGLHTWLLRSEDCYDRQNDPMCSLAYAIEAVVRTFRPAAILFLCISARCASAQSPIEGSCPPPFPPGSVVRPVFLPCQVTREIAWMSGNVSPMFPALFRDAQLDGQVRVQFIVDERGRVEAESIKMLKSSHEVLSEAVRAALATWSASPAYLDTLAVRQVAVHEFTFRESPSDVACAAPRILMGRDSSTVCAWRIVRGKER